MGAAAERVRHQPYLANVQQAPSAARRCPPGFQVVNQLKAIGRLNSACCASAGLPRALTIRNGPESYPDCSMLEVNPLADVPRANLLRVCKRLEPGCEPTDAEDSTDDGNRNYVFV